MDEVLSFQMCAHRIEEGHQTHVLKTNEGFESTANTYIASKTAKDRLQA